MRRTDREVTDFPSIVEIIASCDVMRLGMADGDFPYIVPVNFAYTVHDGQVSFYIHGAMAGRKYEMLKAHPVCSFEMDRAIRMECLPKSKSVTMRYASVMGQAAVTFLEGEDKQKAVDEILMSRYEMTRHFAYNPQMLAVTAVARLDVLALTAKSNPVCEEHR